MAAGCTQAEVAERTGLTICAIRSAEQRRRRMHLSEAAAIAQALGRSLDELVKVSEATAFEPPKMGRPRRAANCESEAR